MVAVWASSTRALPGVDRVVRRGVDADHRRAADLGRPVHDDVAGLAGGDVDGRGDVL